MGPAPAGPVEFDRIVKDEQEATSVNADATAEDEGGRPTFFSLYRYLGGYLFIKSIYVPIDLMDLVMRRFHNVFFVVNARVSFVIRFHEQTFFQVNGAVLLF